MIVGPTNLPAYFNVDADFQAFVQGIHNAMSAMGFIQTTDTGQINPATVVKPSGSGVFSGYEIWRFNDTLQATVPVFVKVEYGSGGAADRPALWWTLGSGSNGAGSVTGQVSTIRMSCQGAQSKSAGVLLPMYACAAADGGDFFIAINVDFASNQFGSGFTCMRPRDQNGVPTNEGIYTMRWNTNNGQVGTEWIPATGSIPGENTNSLPVVAPHYFGRSTGGSNADVCPILLPLQGNWRYGRVLVTNPGDFGGGGSFQTILFGATHTFMSLGQSMGNMNQVGVFGGNAQAWIGMPWE